MKQYIKVTYTLPKKIIERIHLRLLLEMTYNPKITYSQIITNYLEKGFEIMEEELIENNPNSIYEMSKKFPNTIPKTYTIPIRVNKLLDHYSKKLGVKKSHLVVVSCKFFERELSNFS